jgi:hypothetical protein
MANRIQSEAGRAQMRLTLFLAAAAAKEAAEKAIELAIIGLQAATQAEENKATYLNASNRSEIREVVTKSILLSYEINSGTKAAYERAKKAADQFQRELAEAPSSFEALQQVREDLANYFLSPKNPTVPSSRPREGREGLGGQLILEAIQGIKTFKCDPEREEDKNVSKSPNLVSESIDVLSEKLRQRVDEAKKDLINRNALPTSHES